MSKEFLEDAIILDPPGQHHGTVIWLHGLGADCYDFAALPQALRLPQGQGIRFIFPNAPVREVAINGNMPMRAWFDITSQDLTMVANKQHLEQVSLLLEALASEQDGQPVVLAGFSQGGATALFTGLCRNISLAGILSISGWMPPGEDTAAITAKTPIMLLHGTEDEVIPLARAKASYSSLLQAPSPAILKTYPGTGHSLAPEAMADIRDWLLSVLAPGSLTASHSLN